MSYVAQNPKAPDTLWQVFTQAALAYKAKFWTALPLAILLLGLAFLDMTLYFDHTPSPMLHGFSEFLLAHKSMSISFFILCIVIKLLLNGALIFQYQAGVQKSQGLLQAPGLFGLWRSLKNMPFAIVSTIFAMILIAIGMLFAFHPGIILVVYLSMISPVVFLEGKNPIQTLRTSTCLVHQNFWKTVLVNLIIAGLVLCFSEFWKNDHLNIWVRDIFGLIDIVAIGFFASVSVTFYQYLNQRLADPVRQKFYQALKYRPRTVKWAAFLTFAYVLISFAAFLLSILKFINLPVMNNIDTLYNLLDGLIATNFILGLSIVFMAFTYFGGRIARILMIIFSALVIALFAAHLVILALHFNASYLQGTLLYSEIIGPIATVILNILIIVLLASSGAWYRELKTL